MKKNNENEKCKKNVKEFFFTKTVQVLIVPKLNIATSARA